MRNFQIDRNLSLPKNAIDPMNIVSRAQQDLSGVGGLPCVKSLAFFFFSDLCPEMLELYGDEHEMKIAFQALNLHRSSEDYLKIPGFHATKSYYLPLLSLCDRDQYTFRLSCTIFYMLRRGQIY
jgi:hypothetical protein